MRVRIKDITTKVGSGVTPRGGSESYLTEGIPLFRSQNIHNEGFAMDDIAYISEDTDNAMSGSRVKPNDVLLNITGASIGRCFYTSPSFLRGNVNQHVCIIRPIQNRILSPYLHYYLISNLGQTFVKLNQTGGNREGLTIEDIRSFEIDLPPLTDQQGMVAYLDKKCGEIDHQLELLVKQADAYKRLKTAIIHRAVTRGLNPDVPLHASRCDWLTTIPETWKIKRLKDVVDICNGSDYKHIITDDGYPVIGSGGIFETASQYMYQGESLLLGRKGTIDRPMYVNCAFWTVDTMFYTVPHRSNQVNMKFLYYQTLLIPLLRFSTQTALPSMTQTALGQLPYVFPTFQEQKAIASYLDTECEKIDKKIDNINKRVDAYKRLKRALIDEVITSRRVIN
ncbi:MAG: restriction endonuclease subunit S [Bacteroidales bacterium]|nr:restriction endonuclease subunit S [Bacteroidales bacterium]